MRFIQRNIVPRWVPPNREALKRVVREIQELKRGQIRKYSSSNDGQIIRRQIPAVDHKELSKASVRMDRRKNIQMLKQMPPLEGDDAQSVNNISLKVSTAKHVTELTTALALRHTSV